MKRAHYVPVLLSFSSLAVGMAWADEFATPWSGKAPVHTRIILEADRFDPAGSNRAGVQLKLDAGWWTYWRAPGSSGIPPVFDWSGSENLAGKPELSWPVPVREIAYGENLNLYRDEVVFPVEFRAADAARPVKLRLKLTYGACKDMCIPATAEHELIIGPQKRAVRSVSDANARLISAFAVQRPSSDPMTTGLKIREVWEIPDGNRVKIGLRLSGLGKGKSPLVLLEGAGIFQAAEIAPVPAPDERTSILSISVRSASDRRSLSGRRFRITIIDGQRALEQTWVVGAQGSSASGVGVTPVSSGFTDNPEH